MGGLTAVTLVSIKAYSTPRQSLTAGTPCSGCHFSPNGGGGRTELGWGSMNKVGAFTYDNLGLNALHNQKSNQNSQKTKTKKAANICKKALKKNKYKKHTHNTTRTRRMNK